MSETVTETANDLPPENKSKYPIVLYIFKSNTLIVKDNIYVNIMSIYIIYNKILLFYIIIISF